MEHWENKSLENICENINGKELVERWVVIAEYDGLYEASTFGRFKRVKGRSGRGIKQRITAQSITDGGYLQVTLTKDSKSHTFTAHRLIATSFLPNPENKPEVNHKWGIKTDNRVSELEWATKSENQAHSFRVLGKRHNLINFENNRYGKSKKVVCTTLDIEFDSGRQAAEELGVDRNKVSKVCNGILTSTNGLTFRFKKTA